MPPPTPGSCSRCATRSSSNSGRWAACPGRWKSSNSSSPCAGRRGGGGPATGGKEEANLRLRGAKALPARSLAALRLLHRWRDTVAEREDKAPFRIIGNDALLAVSRALPATRADLGHIRELPSSLARRHGDALLHAVQQAKSLPETALRRLERRPPPRVPKDP